MHPNPKINLVIACWGGHRRIPDRCYEEFRDIYLQQQLFHLRKYKHNLTQITFANNKFRGLGEDLRFRSTLNNLPAHIGDANVVLIEQLNIGMSYGLYNFAYATYRDSFDYYIFIEDDFVFVKDNFDIIMFNMFISEQDCGFLSPHIEQTTRHALIGLGISSGEALEAVWKVHNMLPHVQDVKDAENYRVNEFHGQLRFSRAFQNAGLKLCGMSSTYNVPLWTLNGNLCYYKGYDSSKKILYMPVQALKNDGVYQECKP